MVINLSSHLPNHLPPASQAQLDFITGTPGSASPSPGASLFPPASQAGWMLSLTLASTTHRTHGSVGAEATLRKLLVRVVSYDFVDRFYGSLPKESIPGLV